MGYVYYPKDKLERIRAHGILVTDKGLGFIDRNNNLDSLLPTGILRRLPHPEISSNNIIMNISYEDLGSGAYRNSDTKPKEPVLTVEQEELKKLLDTVPEVDKLYDIEEPEPVDLGNDLDSLAEVDQELDLGYEESLQEEKKTVVDTNTKMSWHVGKKVKNPRTGKREFKVKHPETNKACFEDELTEDQLEVVRSK